MLPFHLYSLVLVNQYRFYLIILMTFAKTTVPAKNEYSTNSSSTFKTYLLQFSNQYKTRIQKRRLLMQGVPGHGLDLLKMSPNSLI